MSNEIFMKDSIAWLEHQIGTIAFGEASITIIIHDGSVKRIEKIINIKEQVEG